MRATNRLHACFRQAEVLHPTLLNQLLHRSGNIFDGHVRVDAVLVVQIDDVRLEPLERAFGRFLDVLWLAIQSSPLASVLRIRRPTELRCKHHLIAQWSKSFAHELFVREWTVDFGSIEERDAAFDCRSNQRDPFLLVHGRTIAKAHSHAAQPNRGYFQIAFSKFASLHSFSYVAKFSLPSGHRKPKHSFLNLGALVYFDEVLARFCEAHPVSHTVLISRGLIKLPPRVLLECNLCGLATPWPYGARTWRHIALTLSTPSRGRPERRNWCHRCLQQSHMLRAIQVRSFVKFRSQDR